MIERLRRLVRAATRGAGHANQLVNEQQPEHVADLLSTSALFLISPGRSGTKSLVDLCERHTSMYCVHSPKPWVASIGYLYHQKRLSSESARYGFYATREPYLMRAFRQQRTFFDGDCKNLPLTLEIAELMPSARFIHLLREPEKFIRSGLARGYYRTTPHELWGHLTDDEYRQDGVIALEDQIERIAFFWNEANRIAEEAKQKLGPGRVATIVAENMFRDPDEVFRALQQLDLESVIRQKSGLRIRKLNVQKKNVELPSDAAVVIDQVVKRTCDTRKLYYE